jgi:hypothetical protein
MFPNWELFLNNKIEGYFLVEIVFIPLKKKENKNEI